MKRLFDEAKANDLYPDGYEEWLKDFIDSEIRRHIDEITREIANFIVLPKKTHTERKFNEIRTRYGLEKLED